MASDLADVRQAIGDLLRAETGLAAVMAGNEPWVDEVISGLALAVGEDRIIYLGAAVDDSPERILRIGAFTENLLVTTQARILGEPARAGVVTQVQSRRDLLKLELTSTASGPDGSTDWPGRFRIRALYRSGLEVTIPSSVVDTTSKRASVEAILTGLRADLKS